MRNASNREKFITTVKDGMFASGYPDVSYGICLGFCLRGPLEITDTWEEIFAAEADGTYKEKYQVSDYKPLDLGSEGVINMQIAAFDTDDLADGSGKVPITWIGRELLETERRMNPALVTNENGTYQEGTGTIGGWDKCEMRIYLKEVIKPLIPENIRNNIIEVTKNQTSMETNGKSVTQTTVDDVWIPSIRESSGSIYDKHFTCNTSRIKKKNSGIYAGAWWERDANDFGEAALKKFYNVNGYGQPQMSSFANEDYLSICLCFCT